MGSQENNYSEDNNFDLMMTQDDKQSFGFGAPQTIPSSIKYDLYSLKNNVNDTLYGGNYGFNNDSNDTSNRINVEDRDNKNRSRFSQQPILKMDDEEVLDDIKSGGGFIQRFHHEIITNKSDIKSENIFMADIDTNNLGPPSTNDFSRYHNYDKQVIDADNYDHLGYSDNLGAQGVPNKDAHYESSELELTLENRPNDDDEMFLPEISPDQKTTIAFNDDSIKNSGAEYGNRNFDFNINESMRIFGTVETNWDIGKSGSNNSIHRMTNEENFVGMNTESRTNSNDGDDEYNIYNNDDDDYLVL